MAAGLLAQQPQPTFRTEANFVRVDVFVSRDGSPVGGLTAADFELFEDGVSQTIETFEHVIVRPAGPQDTRVEPDSQRQGNEMAADPRSRVFVIFLDTYHVTVTASHNIAEPLKTLVDRIIGPDDLVGVMTPDMSASGLVLGRKTVVLQEALTKNWYWGRRFEQTRQDRVEYLYEQCFPPTDQERDAGHLRSPLAKALIDRRRERNVLTAVQDLVRHLNGLRDERKAILLVSEGWALFRPNHSLMVLRQDSRGRQVDPVPGRPEIFVGPDGRLTAKADPRDPVGGTQYECDRDRVHVAGLDNEQYFRDILGEANRANASFYPIDPRGLPAFDTPIGPDPPPPPAIDHALLRQRQDALRTAAANTDGLAVMNSNDIDRGLRRIADDLTSYYLIGYYSTNAKLDGRFRSIKVRVKQAGLDVRARRGYRAATAEEVAAARPAPPSAGAPAAAETAALTAALGRLSSIRAGAPFRLHAIAARAESGVRVWIAGELDLPASKTAEWLNGADVALLLSGAGGEQGAARAAVEANARSFLVSVPLESTREIHVQARLTPRAGAKPLGEVLVVRPPETQKHVFASSEPLLFRTTGGGASAVRPAADFRFSRNERARLELPLAAGARATGGRVLDRAGQPLEVPVTLSQRSDGDTNWAAADVTLAPLSSGDYAIEITGEREGARETVVAAIRVVR
jgi:VWFA-related protein